MKKLYLFLISVLFSTFACSAQQDVDIYVAGEDNDGAKVWKNGQLLYNLEAQGNMTWVFSIFVVDTNVYVAGCDYYNSEKSLAALWINGKLNVLNKTSNKNGEFDATARAVFVKDTNIYVVGRKEIDKKSRMQPTVDGKQVQMYDTKTVAVLWKNGKEIILSDGKEQRAEANAVFVSDTNVYVAGYDGNYAVLWENGKKIKLTNGATKAEATSIFVSNNNVYVVGQTQEIIFKNGFPIAETQLFIWKNGKNIAKKYKNIYQYAHSVYVDNDDIYIAGSTFNGKKLVACLWKNGNVQLLANGHNESHCNSVYVNNGNVYTVVSDFRDKGLSVALLLVNGKEQILPSGKHSHANSVFVVKK